MADTIDPTQAMRPEIKRRSFVGLSASLAGLAGSSGGIAAALAAGDDFGKPHAPIVAENDPTLTVERPQLSYALQGANRALGAYAASPAKPSGNARGVVIVQAIWGLDAQLRDVVRRFAKEGYVTIAPDLYAGLSAPSGDAATDIDAFRDAAGKLSDETIDGDLGAGARWIAAQHGSAKVGVIGFCMGGSHALRQTVDQPDRFAAAAIFYGKVRYGTSGDNGAITPIALAYADEIRVPVVGSFGGRDTGILPADVRALDQRLSTLRKPHDIKIYDEAGHGFFDDTRPSYVASAAADAWTRTLSWFARYLA